ncbi:hypothetical protein ACFYVR_00020 [Rhodococcus sp. NPDC003318]|uniref:hypothetical protein n=1 Tax=Rhodococcus sp. NPDC003318 TaxID=3364503 RepID=UPI00369D2366
MSTPTPFPGQHLPGPPQRVDPERIHAEVDELLTGLSDCDPQHDHHALTRQAQILERAHDVLVQALSTVDKI